jgi:hypothetical protein
MQWWPPDIARDRERGVPVHAGLSQALAKSFSSSANARHASAVNASVWPSRSVVSRTRTTRAVPATSTQDPPLAPL